MLEPADLREKMAEMTQAMAARYRASSGLKTAARSLTAIHRLSHETFLKHVLNHPVMNSSASQLGKSRDTTTASRHTPEWKCFVSIALESTIAARLARRCRSRAPPLRRLTAFITGVYGWGFGYGGLYVNAPASTTTARERAVQTRHRHARSRGERLRAAGIYTISCRIHEQSSPSRAAAIKVLRLSLAALRCRRNQAQVSRVVLM